MPQIESDEIRKRQSQTTDDGRNNDEQVNISTSHEMKLSHFLEHAIHVRGSMILCVEPLLFVKRSRAQYPSKSMLVG